MLYRVPGTSGLAIAAATGTGPGVTASLPFVYPKPGFVVGVLVVPRATALLSAAAQLAALALNVADENQEQLVSDSRGTNLVTSVGGTARVLVGGDGAALFGLSFRPFPLQRPASVRDRWTFQVQNFGAAIATLAGVFIFLEPQK